MAKAQKLIKHTSFTVEAGQAPVADHVGKRGGRPLRPWQIRGFNELRGSQMRMLLAPTGSGKSTLIKALAADELAADGGLRVVVAVPQSLIARSFGDDTLELGSRTLRWSVADGNDLTATTARTAAALARFLVAKPSTDPAGRVVVCTHQTLVMAHKKLMKEHKGRKSPWARVSLYLDEAHHSQADEGDDAEKTNNQIGNVVRHWLDAAPGPLLLATATWLRGNLLDIIPQSRAEDFTRFVYTMEEHLRSMVHLKRVSFRFLIGKPEEALRALYDEGHQKTIAWLPPVNSRHVRGAGTSKNETLDRYQGAVGKPGKDDGWTTCLKTKSGRLVRSLDFVTPEGRADRKARLDAAIESSAATPDLLWALGLGKEGFDWPELARGVVVGDRGSIVDVLQMMGRVLRDHPGKETAEFVMVLPWDGKRDVDVEIVKGYIQTVIATMVVEWQFAQSRSRRRAGESIVDDPAKVKKVLDAVIDGAIRDPRAEELHREIIRDALEKNGAPSDDAAVDEVRLLFSSSGRAVALQSQDLSGAVSVEEGVFGGLRGLVATFGYGSLEAFRKAIAGRIAPVAEDTLRARIAGMSQNAYDNGRHAWGPGYVSSVSMPRVYGKTFKELRDGYRFGDHVPEDAIRQAVAGLTKKQYDDRRRALGAGYPNSGAFKSVYGKTFSELRDGTQRGDYATEDEVRARIESISSAEYARVYRTFGPRFPNLASFPRVYGKTYAQVRDGIRGDSSYNMVLDESTIRMAIAGMEVKDYVAARRSMGPGYPPPNELRKHYGKSFAQIRDGLSDVVHAPEHVVKEMIQGLTLDEYNARREALGPAYVDGRRFPSVYGKTFGEVRDGRRRGEYVPADEIRSIVRGMSANEYNAWRKDKGPTYPDPSKFQEAYDVSFAELRDGFRRGEFVALDEFKKATSGMSTSEYIAARRALGPGFPCASAIKRVYGRTYPQIHNGSDPTRDPNAIDEMEQFFDGQDDWRDVAAEIDRRDPNMRGKK